LGMQCSNRNIKEKNENQEALHSVMPTKLHKLD